MKHFGTRLLAHFSRKKTVSEAIGSHESIKQYLDTPISKDIVQNILKNSYIKERTFGKSYWNIHVLNTYKKIEEIKKIIETSNEDCPEKKINTNWNFSGAPVGMIITLNKNITTNQICNIGMVLQNIRLLAREKGLHTHTEKSWAIWKHSLHPILEIPSNKFIFAGMSLGYADNTTNNIEQNIMNKPNMEDFTTFYDDTETNIYHELKLNI